MRNDHADAIRLIEDIIRICEPSHEGYLILIRILIHIG